MQLEVDGEIVNIPEEINVGIYQEVNKNPDKYKNTLH